MDRSGAYVARQLALTAVEAGLAARCQVGMAYAIGRPEPVWFEVDCFGTERVDPAKLTVALRSLTDLRVDATIDRLRLRHIPFRPTATFGHFGRTDGFLGAAGARRRTARPAGLTGPPPRTDPLILMKRTPSRTSRASPTASWASSGSASPCL